MKIRTGFVSNSSSSSFIIFSKSLNETTRLAVSKFASLIDSDFNNNPDDPDIGNYCLSVESVVDDPSSLIEKILNAFNIEYEYR